MEVYAVGNDAAIVIAPLDRDGCPARRSKQAASGGSEPWLTATSELIEQGAAGEHPGPLLFEGMRRGAVSTVVLSPFRPDCRLPRDVRW